MPDPIVLAAPASAGAGIFHAVPAHDPRHLLGLETMSAEAILEILDSAARYRTAWESGEDLTGELAGVEVCNAFFEDSTRTRVSFELAERRLGAISVTISESGSSLSKGESLLDTMRTVVAMGIDLVVVRHRAAGTAAYLARHLDAGVINAGDGAHEHPTQGLLDLMTLRDSWQGRFEGRTLAIVGDIAHSRVARSACFGARALGARVRIAGPATLMPAGVEGLGVEVAETVESALEGADAVMALRLQRERMEAGLLPSLGEYARVWGIDAARVRLMKRDAVVLHPGPLNRGVEITPEVADGERSVILDQVRNGVSVRCAVLARSARMASASGARAAAGMR
jgi:aspartate carbamoyltransferase catalytic subunit